MIVDPAAVALGAAACGAAGLLVPALIARIPEPEPEPADTDPEQGADEEPAPPVPTYAEVAAAPRLRLTSAVVCVGAGGLVGAAVGLAWPLLLLLPLVPVGTALAVVDLRTHLLPTAVVAPAFVGVAVMAVVSALLEADLDALVRAVVAAAAVSALFYLLWWTYPAGMGFGDVRLSAVLGLALGYLGWGELVTGLYGAFLLFSVPGLLLAVLRRDRMLLKAAFPFGPFLLGGALLGVVAGGPLWAHLVAG